MKLSLLVVFLMGGAHSAVLASLLEDTTTTAMIDQNHRRLLLEARNDGLKSETAAAEEIELRNLRESLPADLSICDEYFFGRQTNLPADQVPFCVNGGYCKASWIRDPENPCECLDGYEGPHCEFRKGEAPTTCKLDCEHDGTCKIGAPSWQHYYRGIDEATDTWSNPLDLQHCKCVAGFSGLLCERRGSQCGSNYCHNGGTCIHTNQADGSIKYFCDCSTSRSVTLEGPHVFGGEFCEHESTDFCSDETDPNGEQFCVNGGECKSESHLGCNCKPGYVGPICEFEDVGQDPPVCSLQCENHGICRKGVKDVSILEKYGIHNRHLEDGDGYTEDFEHCVCPRGYVGLQCEFQLDICPGGAHACLNGGDCVTIPNGNNPQDVTYGCDCTNAETKTSRFAGESCEMESTEFCTVDGAKSSSGVGLNNFCTNGGTCKAYVQHFEEHAGCNCPDGFGGENCQFEQQKRDGLGGAGIAAVLIVGCSLLGTVLLLRIRRRQKIRAYYEHMASKAGVPPSLDLMARAMQVDDDMEYGDSSSASFAVPPPRQQNERSSRSRSASANQEDVVYMRRSEWPNGRPETASSIFNDIPLSPMSQEAIINSRQKEWPNDAHNDASNPIHIFDDISEATPDLSPVQSERKIV